ncbi:DUF418 domain-containing protein [Aureibacter tunicatorum]|uniref:DUF418 domain-containing protein n=1 Tax=Aureibacter tunicatorum TaxID=866807 RepID=A0AAE3XJN4_9BACT|nr:DUF418 domain-containing protein [Aureibacter tunicatorum]MDR6237622.1 uncharacterized protein [Aureibacter tunicatorum]BDD02657.1 membrane protein [Aureibacter tunicatorum]
MEKLAPTLASDRVVIIDVLRGFAILGILLANILSWSGYKFIPYEMIENLSFYNLDQGINAFINFFIDTKFYTLFSILFGIGFYFQYKKHRENQAPFVKTYTRRMLVLFVFGIIHTLIWSGDILTLYALMGLVLVYFLRNLTPKQMLIGSAILFNIPILYNIIVLIVAPGWMTPDKALAMKTYLDMTPMEVTNIFQHGNILEVWKLNMHNVMWRWFDMIPDGRPFKVLGLFLLGYYVASTKFIQNKSAKKSTLIISWSLGVSLTLFSMWIGGSIGKFPKEWTDIAFKFLMPLGQIALCTAYVSTMSIAFKTKIGQKVLNATLSHAGRMSFSNYIMHTVLGIAIFYSFGLGFFGTLSLAEVMIVAVLIYAFQIAYSKYWLQSFKFGPLEWLWRCLTFGKMFSITKEPIKISERKEKPVLQKA